MILRAVRGVHKLRVQSRPDVSRSETPSYSSAMRMSSPLAETQRTLRTAGSEDKTEGCSPCALRALARNMRRWVCGDRSEAWTRKSMKEKIQRLLLAKARRTRRKSRFNGTQCQCLSWRSPRLGEKHEVLGVWRQGRSLDHEGHEKHEGEDPTSASRKGAKDAESYRSEGNKREGSSLHPTCLGE